jgi:hypothetical protein
VKRQRKGERGDETVFGEFHDPSDALETNQKSFRSQFREHEPVLRRYNGRARVDDA